MECKKREKKKKKPRLEEKGSGLEVPAPPEKPLTLNLSTEESGYESDLTRKSGSGSDKSSDTSVSNSPVSNRSVKLETEPEQDGAEQSDLEQRDLSLESITTINGTISGQGAKTPEQGAKLPAKGAKFPEHGAKILEAGTKTPELGANKLEHKAKIPESGAKIPSQEAKIPEQGTKILEKGAKTPELRANKPEQGAKIPEPGAKKPEQKAKTTPVNFQIGSVSESVLSPVVLELGQVNLSLCSQERQGVSLIDVSFNRTDILDSQTDVLDNPAEVLDNQTDLLDSQTDVPFDQTDVSLKDNYVSANWSDEVLLPCVSMSDENSLTSLPVQDDQIGGDDLCEKDEFSREEDLSGDEFSVEVSLTNQTHELQISQPTDLDQHDQSTCQPEPLVSRDSTKPLIDQSAPAEANPDSEPVTVAAGESSCPSPDLLNQSADCQVQSTRSDHPSTAGTPAEELCEDDTNPGESKNVGGEEEECAEETNLDKTMGQYIPPDSAAPSKEAQFVNQSETQSLEERVELDPGSEPDSTEVQGVHTVDLHNDKVDNEMADNVTSLSVEWDISQIKQVGPTNKHAEVRVSGVHGTPDLPFSFELADTLPARLTGPTELADLSRRLAVHRVHSEEGEMARLEGEATETSLPMDFGESLPPRLSGLVNKQFRMYRLVKEAGMELGVLITKKFNKEKRTTGYIIAYIEPNGLVHR